MAASLNPAIIPLFKKRRFLNSLSEDDFRDQVVRPLYLLKGLLHAKDVCGSDEDGKDCYFFGQDAIRGRVLYVVQTKSGDVKMSAKARDNLLNIEAQLRTALQTPVRDASTRQKLFPDYVILAASGEINAKAEKHITDEIKDSRILFRDSDDFIPEIDTLMPELWYGMDVKRLPYLKKLRDYLVSHSESIDISQIVSGSGVAAPVSDDSFVQLYVNRYTTKLVKHKDQKEEKLDFEEFPIQDVLRRREILVLITGDAGSGKTTSLRRLAMILVQDALQSSDAPYLPVLLRCIDITKNDRRLVQTAAEVTKRITPEDAPAFQMDDLASGHVVLLVDGFDELASEQARKVVLDRIDEFHNEYGLCRVVLTSRDSPFTSDITNRMPFLPLRISPIHIGQAQKMVERLSQGKQLSKEATHELVRRLEKVHGIDLSPLLVTVFVATTDYARTDIPANITELFKKFTEMMLGRWDQSKGLAQQYQAQVKDFLLCRIAFKMHYERVTTIPLEECRRIVEQDLEERGLEADINVLFDEIVYRSGLVRVEDEALYFRHLLIQEFFAGRAIGSHDLLQTFVIDHWWMRAIVFYFGQNPDDHKGLAILRQSLDGIDGTSLFQAACAVGLSIQACYLTKKKDKCEALEWVVDAMASTKSEVLEFFEKDGRSDTVPFIMYYLFGRDAVGAKVMSDVATMVAAKQNEKNERSPHDELKLFWCIAGLIEAGDLEQAELLIDKYHPKDQRLLLGLLLGSVYVAHVQFTTQEQKRVATRINKRIAPRVAHLMKNVVSEMKSIVLEVQHGKVKALEGPANEQ